jgi:hypothetical protein
MAVFTGNGYLVDDLAALKAIPAIDRPAFKVALLVAGLGWYEYDNAATSGGIVPDDSPASGQWFPVSREVLRANRTYYVRTDGSDSNTGLVDSSGGAFLTIQKAIDIASTLDISGFNLKIRIGDGTYTQTLLLKEVVGYSSAGSLVIEGDTTTPSNVVISVTSNNCFLAKNINSTWDIQGVQLQTTTSGSCIRVENASIRFGSVAFGACAVGHIVCDTAAKIECIANYSIVGNALYHWFLNANTVLLCTSRTITLTGTPAFSVHFLRTSLGAIANIPVNTFSGSATGARYNALSNSAIETAAAGASYLPGNASGTTASGGQYV